MAVDRLVDKIRKTKSPVVLDLDMLPEHIPVKIMEAESSYLAAYNVYCKQLLEGLKEIVAAVRISFAAMACMGAEGLDVLSCVLKTAKKLGYYVLLDVPESLSAQAAQWQAERYLAEDSPWVFDGLVISAYIGSDLLRGYVDKLKDSGKDLFVVVRTSNRSAPELQDLLTGTRLAHLAKAEIVNRFAQTVPSKSGYAQVGIVAGASAADSIKTLRSKFKNMFMILDGMDYPNANAKNCAHAFDPLGRGAVACVGLSVTAAWQKENSEDYMAEAVAAAERHKKNLCRYISIY